jgi:hypothetical protein
LVQQAFRVEELPHRPIRFADRVVVIHRAGEIGLGADAGL